MLGDLVIVMTFEYVDSGDDAPDRVPIVVAVDEANRITGS